MSSPQFIGADGRGLTPRARRTKVAVSHKITIGQRFLLGWGKVRRFYLHVFRRGYVERSIARRTGECRRCGACCKLMFTCPHLDESREPFECKVHETRSNNCRFFPIDERDLRDRDIIMPDQPCGFSFNTAAETAHAKKNRKP